MSTKDNTPSTLSPEAAAMAAHEAAAKRRREAQARVAAMFAMEERLAAAFAAQAAEKAPSAKKSS